MSGFTPIDASTLPKPDVIEDIDYEVILAQNMAAYENLFDADNKEIFDAHVESDPAIKLIQLFSYKEMGFLQKINNKCLAQTLAHAEGADLEHIGFRLGVIRAVVDEGDPNHIPPIEPTYESDTVYRRRIQLAVEALSTAGSKGAYKFHGLSVGDEPSTMTVETPIPGQIVVTYEFAPNGFSSLVKDVNPFSPSPCEITIPVLGWNGNGVPSQEILDKVEAHLSEDKTRPQGDRVTVQAADVIEYQVRLTLEFEPSFDKEPLKATYRTQVAGQVSKYVVSQHRFKGNVSNDGFKANSWAENVTKSVTLEKWNGANWVAWTDINCTGEQAAYCLGSEVL